MAIERITPQDHDRRPLYFRHMAAYRYATCYANAANVLDCGSGLTGYLLQSKGEMKC